MTFIITSNGIQLTLKFYDTLTICNIENICNV